LVKHLSLTSGDALRWLANFNGIALDSPQSDKNGPPSRERRKDGPKPAPKQKASEKPILMPDAMDPAERAESSHPDGWMRNPLFLFLGDEFGEDAARDVAELYHLGTGPRGETVFWYTDIAGNVRTAKATRYNRRTGRRDKNFTKALHPQSAYLFRPCFFGEHLLPLFPGVPVDFVESEKSAMLCTLDAWDGGEPERIYLATGGKNSLPEASSPRWDLLRGRELTFWPDVAKVPEGGGWEDAGPLKAWRAIAHGLRERLFFVETVETMQRHATPTERAMGWDIADEIVRARARRRARVKRRKATKRRRTRGELKQRENSEAPAPLPWATTADATEAEPDPPTADTVAAEVDRIRKRLVFDLHRWRGGIMYSNGAHVAQSNFLEYITRRYWTDTAADAEFLDFLRALEKAIFGGPE
jgi:hypothetical protein